MLAPFLLLLFLLASLHWLLSFHVLRSNRHAPVNRAFALFALFAGFWTISIAVVHHLPLLTLYLTRLTFVLGAALAYTFLRLTLLVSTQSRSWPYLKLIALPCTAVFVSLAITKHVVQNSSLTPSGLVVLYGTAHLPFAIYIVICFSAGFVLLFSDFRTASGISRTRLRCFLMSLFLPILGAVTTNVVFPLLLSRSRVGVYGPVFALVFFGFIVHGFVRYRLFDVTLFVRQSVTTTLATVVSLVPLVTLLFIYWPRLTSALSPVVLIGLLVGFVLIVVTTPTLHRLTECALDTYIHRRREDYGKTLKDTSRLLTKVLDLRSLLRLIESAVSDSIGASSVTIFLQDEDGHFSASLNEAGAIPDSANSTVLPPNVLLALGGRKEPFVLGDPGSEQRESAGPTNRPQDVLFIPIISDDDVVGIMALGPKTSGAPFFSQDIDLLSTLANQAGVAIRNAQLYEQVVLISEHLQNIVGTIESGVIAVDSAGDITIFNRAAAQLTGLPADTVLGRGISALPAVLAVPLVSTAEDGQPRILAEVEVTQPAGSPMPVICLTSPLREPAGGLLGAVAVLSDLSPLKELETERRRAERLAYFEVLAAGIGHEIKNPLVAIKTFTQLLPRKFLDEQFRHEFVRIVGREIRRMEHLAERLRSLARPGGGPHCPVELRAPIIDAAEVVQPRFNEKGIATQWAFGGRPGQVLGDRAALEQLFLNLFVNALEAMEPGGTLSLRLQSAGDRVTVEVEDTGLGIPDELLSRIFEPFVTSKIHGSGLGLAICASIANAHHARIRAANKPGQSGAIFTIEFPAVVLASTPVKA